MATFPVLSTGAIVQYPLMAESVQATQVIRFLDGTDQRFSVLGGSLRQWQIRLDLLSESEIQQLEMFYAGQLGDYQTFEFPDLVTGASVSNCRFAAPDFVSDYVALGINATSFWVVETRG